LGDLQLATPAAITGRVLTRTGAAIPDVAVRWLPQTGLSVWLAQRNLAIDDDGRVQRSVTARSDAQGRFRLAVGAGSPGLCLLVNAAGNSEPLVPPVPAEAPATIAFELHDLVTLRVVTDTGPLPGVRGTVVGSALDRLVRRHTDQNGELRYLRAAAAPFTLALEPPGRERIEVTVPATLVGPLIVELPKTATAKVRLELSGEHPVRQVVAEWTRLGLPASPIVVQRFRGAHEGPLECELPSGP